MRELLHRRNLMEWVILTIILYPFTYRWVKRRLERLEQERALPPKEGTND